MHPRFRETFRDWMITPHGQLERCPPAMASRGAGARIGNQLPILEIPERSGFFGAVAPSADADHLVKCCPSGEGIVGSVHADEPSASCDVFCKRCLQFRRPSVIWCVVVENDNL